MTVIEKVQEQIDKFGAIAQRRGLFDDERAELGAFRSVIAWEQQDRSAAQAVIDESERIVADEQAAAQEQKSKDHAVFNSYRDGLKQKGRMR